MCVARLVLQHWRDKYKEILKEGNIREKLSKIYVDDNRCVVEKIKPGLRFIESEGKFKFKEEWIEEDMKVDPIKRTIKELGKAMNSVNIDLNFTFETEEDFAKKRLPTLAFEIWSTRVGI